MNHIPTERTEGQETVALEFKKSETFMPDCIDGAPQGLRLLQLLDKPILLEAPNSPVGAVPVRFDIQNRQHAMQLLQLHGPRISDPEAAEGYPLIR